MFKRKDFKVFVHLLIYIPFRILTFILTIIPGFLYERISEILGNFAFFTMRKTKKRIIKNLEIAFKEKYTKEERKQICKKIFKEIILNFLETIQLLKKPERVKKIVIIEGKEILENLLKEKKGIVAVCAHLGNFPIIQTSLSNEGFPVNVIVRYSNNKYIARFMSNWRKKNNLPTIPKTDIKKTIEKSVEWLKKGGILCIYLDQYTRNGVLCDFFGEKFYAPVGPATFARKYNLPVVGIFTFRLNKNLHKIVIEGPYKLQRTSSVKKDIAENTQLFIKRVEYYVDKYPEMWFSWLHRAFR